MAFQFGDLVPKEKKIIKDVSSQKTKRGAKIRNYKKIL